MGFDFSKLTQLFQLVLTVLPQILALFGGTAAQPAGATPPKP